MQVARVITTSVTAAALAFSMLASAIPANAAVSGFHASYFSESAFLFAKTGDTVQFAVGFFNNGDQGWVKGSSASQASLHTNAPFDNTTDFNAGWASNWKAPNVYAAQSSDLVAPGQVGYFIYNITVPSNAALDVHHFYGRVAIDGVGPMEDWGYFQDVNVQTAPASTAGPALSSCSGLNDRTISCAFGAAMSTDGANDIQGYDHYALSGGLTIGGAVASSDAKTVTLTLTCTLTGAAGATGCGAANRLAQNGTYTVTVNNVASAAGILIGTSNFATFTLSDQSLPTVTISRPGTFEIGLRFSKPMAAETLTAANIKWDSAPFPGAINIFNVGGSGPALCEASPDCDSYVNLNFASTALPQVGSHTLDLKDVADGLGNKISPNPTSFTVTISTDTTAPTATVSLTSQSNLSGKRRSRIYVTYSEAIASTSDGYAAGVSGQTVTNFTLRNPDGSLATTGGASGSGSALTLSISGSDFGPGGSAQNRFDRKRTRLRVNLLLKPGVTYSLEVANLTDQNNNAISPNPTIGSVTWAGDTTSPTVKSVIATPTKLAVNFSEDITSSVDGDGSANTKACLISSYQAGAGSTNASLLATWLTTLGNYSGAISNGQFFSLPGDQVTPGTGAFNSGQGAIDEDNTDSCLFSQSAGALRLAAGTYTLQISASGSIITDDYGNQLSPNPTNVTFTVVDNVAPTLVSGAVVDTANFNVTFSKQMTGGVAVANSAGNPNNYNFNNTTYGNICTSGNPAISSNPAGTVWTINCTLSTGAAGTGVWSAGSGTLAVQNVADISGNVINPNPSSVSFTGTAAAAISFKWSTITSPQTVGTTSTGVTLTVVDASGATLTNYTAGHVITFTQANQNANCTTKNSTTTITSANGGVAATTPFATTSTGAGTTIGFAAGVSDACTINWNCTTSAATSIVATDNTNVPVFNGSSAAVLVQVSATATATKLVVTNPTSAPTVGSTFSETVTATDANGNTITTVSGTKSLTIAMGGGSGVSPAGSTPTFPVSGNFTFTSGVTTLSFALVSTTLIPTVTVTDTTDGIASAAKTLTAPKAGSPVALTVLSPVGFPTDPGDIAFASTELALISTTFGLSGNTISSITTTMNGATASTKFINPLQTIDTFGNQVTTSTFFFLATEELTGNCSRTTSATLTNDSGVATTACNASGDTATVLISPSGDGRLRFKGGTATSPITADTVKIILTGSVTNTVSIGTY